MRKRSVRFMFCLVLCLAIALPLSAQGKKGGEKKGGGDPITGTWTGDWGPSPGDRNTVSVDMKLGGKTVTGTVHSVNFQRPDVELKNGTYDPATRAVHMEADTPGRRGGPGVHFVIDGKVEGGSMTGSWNHDQTKGDFKLTKKEASR